jgi:hypothetical protein
MSTFLIGYDLNKTGKDYKALTDEIKKLGAWWHHLDSTWLVISSLTASQIRDKLKPFIDSDDELLVVLSSGVGAWTGFNQSGSDWLKNNL